MKGLILLADGFEETEALVTVDILKRANLHIDMISLMPSKNVTGSHHIPVIADYLFNEIAVVNYDYLILPGGAAVFQNLKHNQNVENTIHYFMKKQQLIAAICAAPILLGQYGYLKDKNYVCFKGCEDPSFLGNYQGEVGCVKHGNIISAKSMYYTIEFALTIIKSLLGQEMASKVKDEIMSK